MSETTTTEPNKEAGSETSAATEATATEANPPGAEALGDAGKKALDAMKAERNTARDEAKKLRDEFAALKAQVEGKESEFKAQRDAQRVKDEALAAANERILKAEVRAAAASKLSDPADALRFLNLSDFEVGSDGEVDASQVAKAIDDLVASKPYLAAQGGKRFQGTADGGARNESGKSIDDQIAEATKAGDHRRAISLKRQKAYANKT